MTRSTVKPDTIKLWKLEAIESGLQLHLSAHWNAKQIAVEDEHGSRQEWEYDEMRFAVPYEGARDGVDAFLVTQEARLLLIAKTLWEAKHDAPALTAEETKQFADYATQERIRTALHPVAGAGEEIKILREQITALVAQVGIEATAGFARLNSVAVAAIQEAREKETRS